MAVLLVVVQDVVDENGDFDGLVVLAGGPLLPLPVKLLLSLPGETRMSFRPGLSVWKFVDPGKYDSLAAGKGYMCLYVLNG